LRAKIVSSTGATRLSVQLTYGSYSWLAGGPLTNTNEQPDNKANASTIRRIDSP
jgi:hypothetical protein